MNIEDLKEELYEERNIYRRNYKGFEYWIIRPHYQGCRELGHHTGIYLCGYVTIPRDSKYFISDNYNSYDVECHGGLTFGDSLDYLSVDFCIGFDCAHCYDINTLDTEMWFQESRYRNVDYVDRECKSIIDQLLEVK